MRIAYLTSQYPAPSHTFIRREVFALRRAGHHVRSLSVRPPLPGLSGLDVEEAERTFYVLPPRPARLLAAHLWGLFTRPLAYVATLALALRHRVPGLQALAYAFFYFAEAIYVARELKRARIQHVHNHFANSAAIVGLLATRFLKLPWSVTLHGISEFDYPAGVVLADKLLAAEFVSCVSHFGRAQAMRLINPSHWDKMFITRCGIEVGALPERPAREGQRLRVVCVARLSPEKGLAGLLSAFADVVKGGIDAELVILGDGPEQADLERRVRELGLEGRCSMPGRVPEAEALENIARADVFAMASFMEGLPVVLMEALGLGVPAVAPCVAGIPELVEHHVSGLLFPPGDWQGLTEQLRTLLSDAALRQRLGAAGRERVFAEFDIDKAVAPLLERYEAREAAGAE